MLLCSNWNRYRREEDHSLVEEERSEGGGWTGWKGGRAALGVILEFSILWAGVQHVSSPRAFFLLLARMDENDIKILTSQTN